MEGHVVIGCSRLAVRMADHEGEGGRSGRRCSGPLGEKEIVRCPSPRGRLSRHGGEGQTGQRAVRRLRMRDRSGPESVVGADRG
ncbi:hypothetical protein [Streptomyces sp. NPDC056660]|uniref:hypothetical protein n=1 Tax=Streptomyces sp. NPDC056660 TaxID=3345897 RepID=UPI00369BDBC1